MTAPGPDADAVRRRGRSNVTLLVQPRPRGNSSYVVYADSLDAPEVHLHVRLLEDLRRAALEALPDETIGALLGRPCRDDYGIYVVVENALTAEPGEHTASRSEARMTDAGHAALHGRAARQHPTLEPVGWWHSHPHGEPRYSAVDRLEQATCTRPYHVGIVVVADRLDGAPSGEAQDAGSLGVYVGPAATLLERRERLPATARSPATPTAGRPPAGGIGGAVIAAAATPPPSASNGAPATPRATRAPAVAPDPPDHSTWAVVAAGITALIVCVGTLLWAILQPPGGRDGTTPAGAAAIATTVVCRPREERRVTLEAPPVRALSSADPRVALAQASATRMTVFCRRPGVTVVTIGAPSDRRRIVVRVRAASGGGR